MEKKGHIKYITPIIIGVVFIITLLVCDEWLSYQHCKLYDSYERELSFLTHYPNSAYSPEIKGLIRKYEKKYVDSKFNELKIPTYIYDSNIQEYLSLYRDYISFFPNGKLKDQVDEFINETQEEYDFRKINKVGHISIEDCDAFLEKYPNSSRVSKVEYLKATVTYKDNSLTNGSQPYSRYYGSNNRSGGSRVIIKSSSNHDCIVTVKYGNADGIVAGHVYVRRGDRAEIPLPSGRTYQVFFYSGEGWYPYKEMPKDIFGGFLFNESFSYDKTAFYLDYGESMEYTLTPTTNGNFTPSSTNQNNFF